MNERQAQLILETVKEAGKYSEPIPGYEDLLVEEAEKIVSEAYQAQRAGARGDLVSRILWLAQEDDAKVIAEEIASDSPVQQKESLVATDAASNFQGEDPGTPGSAGAMPEEIRPPDSQPNARPSGSVKIEAAYEAKARANARIKKENLPIPPVIEGEAPTLPRDLTKSSDVEIRRLSSEFNACLARANYLVALDEADELSAKQIASYYLARAYKLAAAENPKATKPILDAKAAEDEHYQWWRDKHLDHLVGIKIQKALRDTYQGNCDRLSREWTMRVNEREVTR